MNFKENQVVEYVGGDEFVDCTKSGLEGMQPSIKKNTCCIFLEGPCKIYDEDNLALVEVTEINDKGNAERSVISVKINCLRVYRSKQQEFNTGDIVWYDGKDPELYCVPAGQFAYLGDSYFENCAVISNGNGYFYHVLKENLK